MKVIYTLFLLLCMHSSTWAQLFPQRTAPILRHPSTVRIKRLYNLNSSYEELNLSISPDGKYLYFMSRRGGQLWSKLDNLGKSGRREYDGDIWYSKRVSGKWGNPRCLGRSINTHEGEDEPNISPDGQTVYFQSWANFFRHGSGGPYFSATLNGIYWGPKKPLGGGIYRFFKDQFFKEGVSVYGTDGMTVSPNGKMIIFAAGPGSGASSKMNLYMSKKNSAGYWSYPLKLNVSTSADDRSPFLAADGKTLYFSSTGYTGKGKLDIFKCTINSNGYGSGVVNIGAPFNTTQDDYSFILTADGREAYFSRNGDIHFADISKSPKAMKPQPTLIISGVIRDKKTGRPLRAKISFKNSKGQIVASSYSNSATGEYSVVIKYLTKTYYQSVSKSNYQHFKKTLNVSYKGYGKNVIHANAALMPPVSAAVLAKQRQEAARKRQEAIQRQKIAEQKRLAALKKAQEEAKRKREAQRLKVLKEKQLKRQAKASVYKDFS